MGGSALLETLRAEVDAARELFQHGRPADSLAALGELRARLEREVPSGSERQLLLAQVLVSLASASFEVSGDLGRATALLDRAESVAGAVDEGAGRDRLLVALRGQLGLLLLRNGRNEEALTALDRAAGMLEGADAKDQETILVNRGVLHLERGDLDAARLDFEACLAIAERTGDEVGVSTARHNLGWTEFRLGRLPRALTLMGEAAAQHPIARLDRARVLREAGLLTEADELLEEVAEDFRHAGLGQDLGETELVRAECLLLTGDLAAARDLARSARGRFVRRGNRTWQRRAELLLLRCRRSAIEARTAQGASEPARRAALRRLAVAAQTFADRCRVEGRRDLARQAVLISREASLRAQLSGRAGGGPALAGARPAPLRRRDPLVVRLLTREVRSLAAEIGGDRRRAKVEVRRGLAELGGYQQTFGSLDLRTASAVHGSALARLGLELVLRDGSAAEVLTFVERARAVSTRLPQVRPPGDPATAALVARLRAVDEEARSLEGDPTGLETARGLRREAARLQHEIRGRAWELEGGQGAADAPPRVRRLAAAAEADGSVVVSFARHRSSWVAVHLDGRRAVLTRLGPVAEVAALVARVRADLDAAASPALPPLLARAVHDSLAAGLARLDALLLAPLDLTGRRLVLSCSGDLMLLPWGLLPSRTGTATSVTPSAAAWLRAREGRRPSRPRVVAVAGPGLRLAEAEVAEVVGRWEGSRALLGPDATSQRVRQALVEGDLVHVSAHGRHRSDSPLFSSVRLHDGSLYAHEIDPGAGLAGCVVLSACDAGLATTRPGEEMLGLAQVLLHLGSRSVVAAVARVNDEVSAGVMADLHARLAQGKDVSTSLAEAQRESLDRRSPAAFVSYGAAW
ncbi:CHAT domain-containing protein [Nocardioides sp. HDW12B]|uniref:CHAT domain-containing protein n=1 Tax=Nocardioides sp. HDW12B TaxID=2714939 RepID=UPI00140C9807|nr:CHAT domain-containing tetratricopeptide repeat protein [Nocardioides sp. HDW12B]QIK68088.1 CHAT domain-containing protein [Nocardioides sp. HDW12B]